ncbi:hypothetical protein L598_001600000130 [Mesorhizobium sp. J18]|nr:hypothetical protein L598_001600000130 [Mesorhizobium sp. J18]
MSMSITPLTPARWPAFEDLFGKQGACYGCWYTHFRLPPAVRRENNRQRNKDHMRERVMAGPPPGLPCLRWGCWMQIQESWLERIAERKAGRPMMRYML